MKKKLSIVTTAIFAVSLVFCSMVMWSGHLEDTEGESESVSAQGKNTDKLVIVIDPGHGGMDGGASSADGTMEKDINLEIAVKLKEIMEDYPVEVIMTRDSDVSLHSDSSVSIKNQKRQDLLKRKEIIDQSGAELAICIHLNSFKEDASVYGAQVFYPKANIARTDGRTYEHDSKQYAESVQKSIETNISDGRERSVMSKGDFLVFENPTCPMVLVECGFLSNKSEGEKLKNPEYQGKMASAIWQGINENLCLEKETNMEIIESTNKQQKK